MDVSVSEIDLDKAIDHIDKALARFMCAELASAEEVCDVLLDLRLLLEPC